MTQQIRKVLQELGRAGTISASASHPPLLELLGGKPTSPVSPAPSKTANITVFSGQLESSWLWWSLPDHGAELGSAQTQIWMCVTGKDIFEAPTILHTCFFLSLCLSVSLSLSLSLSLTHTHTPCKVISVPPLTRKVFSLSHSTIRNWQLYFSEPHVSPATCLIHQSTQFRVVPKTKWDNAGTAPAVESIQ